MAIDLTVMQNKVRRGLGSPTTTEFTADALSDCIDTALDVVTHMVAGADIQITYFLTVADQQAYPIPTQDADDNSISISKIYHVFWDPRSLYQPQYQFDPDIIVTPYKWQYLWRSIDLIDDMRMRQIRDIASYGNATWIVGGNIYLKPVPAESDGRVYYTYTEIISDITDLADRYEELVRAAAIMEGLLILGARRSNTGSIDREGLVASRNLPDMDKLYERHKKKFDEKSLQLLGFGGLGLGGRK